jgi:hypothetical protein
VQLLSLFLSLSLSVSQNSRLLQSALQEIFSAVYVETMSFVLETAARSLFINRNEIAAQ